MKKLRIGDLEFRNPVLTASGTFGMGELMSDFLDYSQLGGITLKTVTRCPRPGNIPPRIKETPAGLLNSIGLENAGFEAIYKSLKEKDTLKPFDTNVIFSIAGDTAEDFTEMAKAFEEIEGIDMFELNLSCPNVHEGGRRFDESYEQIESIVSGVAKSISKPFSTKLSPSSDLPVKAEYAANAGSNALTISNTYLGMAFDLKTGEPVFKNKVAGLSGPAVKPMALYQVYRVANSVNVSIIASGGVASVEDAVEFIHAGATLVSVGTMNFVEPDIAEIIARGLRDWKI